MKKFFNLITVSAILLIAVSFSYSQYPVSGHVYYSDDFTPVTNGYVNAYDANSHALLATTPINPGGEYSFNQLPSIQIDVIGFPNVEPEMDGAFVPTYFPNKLDFLTATQILPTEPLYNVDIYAKRISSGGIGNPNTSTISGVVTLKNDFLKDAIIYAQQGEDMRGFAITDARGSFKIKNLPLGDYVLVVHRIGCTNSQINVTLTPEGLKNINFVLDIAKKATLNKINFKLNQNYPNPFNPKTNISFIIPNDGQVNISVYNMNGQMVKELVNGFKTAGEYKIEFDGTNLASGVYFYTLKNGNFTDTKKLILVK